MRVVQKRSYNPVNGLVLLYTKVDLVLMASQDHTTLLQFESICTILRLHRRLLKKKIIGCIQNDVHFKAYII